MKLKTGTAVLILVCLVVFAVVFGAYRGWNKEKSLVNETYPKLEAMLQTRVESAHNVLTVASRHLAAGDSLLQEVARDRDILAGKAPLAEKAAANEALTRDAAALLVRGRISLRDEKEPQLMVDSFRPLSDLTAPGRTAAQPRREDGPAPAADRGGTVYVRLPGREDPLFRRVGLLRTMFPGTDRMVIYLSDSKKQLAAPCLIHDALVAELTRLCGKDNVVVK